MKGKKVVVKPVRAVEDSYRIKKSVINGIPLKDVDLEGTPGGFAFAALIPLLSALGIPIASSVGKWIGSKIFGDKRPVPTGYIKNPAGPEGSGIMRAGDKRGKGIMRAGKGGFKASIIEPSDMPIKIPQRTRNGKMTRAGDIPLTSKYVDIYGMGINIEKLRTKLIPFIKANDPEGFKNKIMKTIKKKAR